MTCKCGEGCEEFSCFVGYDCKCCIEAYGERTQCDCHDCRMARVNERNRLAAEEVVEILRSAPDVAATAPVDAREVD